MKKYLRFSLLKKPFAHRRVTCHLQQPYRFLLGLTKLQPRSWSLEYNHKSNFPNLTCSYLMSNVPWTMCRYLRLDLHFITVPSACSHMTILCNKIKTLDKTQNMLNCNVCCLPHKYNGELNRQNNNIYAIEQKPCPRIDVIFTMLTECVT